MKTSSSPAHIKNTSYFPAEWVKQHGVMLAWPHENTDWCSHLDSVRNCIARICAAISQVEFVFLLHAPHDDSFQLFLQKEKTNFSNIKPISCHFNDIWVRDYGAISTFQNGIPQLLNFRFNAWGQKYDYVLDNQVNQSLLGKGLFTASLRHISLVLEGGSIDSDGCGTILTTAQCMHQRHPTLSDLQIYQQLKESLGIQRIFMLENGYLIGDDTDAHIDTLARFTSPTDIVYMSCDDPNDEHYEPLKAMQKELLLFQTLEGKPYRLHPLPWPRKRINDKGQRLAMSYANFLIINHAVLLPIYQTPADNTAILVLEKCFPNHQIIPIACETLIEQGGSLHCLSMQFPQGFIE